MENYQPTEQEMNTPLNASTATEDDGRFKCSYSLPTNDFILGEIAEVKYGAAYFKGEIQYVKRISDKTFVLDEQGQKIVRKEFKLKVRIESKYKTDKGEDRYLFLRLGASFSPKANLPKVLNSLGVSFEETPSPNQIKQALEGIQIKFLVSLSGSNPKNDGYPYENIKWDSVMLSEPKETFKEEDIAWDE